ncbi:MAG: hypothetical protein RLN69_04515, partial [Woeseiaceae bacterium]
RGLKSVFRLRQPGAWYRVRYGDSGELAATRFTNLLGQSDDGAIQEVDEIDNDAVHKALEKLFPMSQFEQLNEEIAEQVLGTLPTTDFVSVLDVGQGNANALWSNHGGAHLYFDVGGGVLQHAKTYPPSMKFCVSRDPVIILSHWDWDHWSSAAVRGHPYLRRLTWIVPDQGSLPGVHASFAEQLIMDGATVYRWPDEWKEKQFGQLTIQRCTGRGRNDSGLALLIDAPDGTDRRVLLTGDASYESIPAIANNRSDPFHAVVAPHHGGKPHVTNPLIALPTRSKLRRLIYSYGSPNYYGHPHYRTQHQHRQAKWYAKQTRHTVPSQGPRPAHVGIRWSDEELTTGCQYCQPLQW